MTWEPFRVRSLKITRFEYKRFRDSRAYGSGQRGPGRVLVNEVNLDLRFEIDAGAESHTVCDLKIIAIMSWRGHLVP
jgi:hypothetical protein